MQTRNVHDRLATGAAILALIDCRRREPHSQLLGSNIERLVIERELRELEEDLQRNVEADRCDNP